MPHIAVERNRRRQMNDHLKVLRSITPCFYIKRSDQASIIGGVVDFIKELHQVVQSLESNKRRKTLSPSPKTLVSPHLPPLCSFDSPTMAEGGAAFCNSRVADVEAKIYGSNLTLKVITKRIRGQIVKIIKVLEKLSFEIIHLNITTMEDAVLYSFIIKIGLECGLSLEEVTLQVQQSFNPHLLYSTKEAQ